MALVVTLSAVVLLTVLVLAFFSRAQLNRQVSYSSTNLVKSDYLARTALTAITGQLRDEITDTSRSTVTTTSGVSIYQPSSPAYSLPAATGTASPTGSIVKVSASGVAIRPGGSVQGSSVSISASSLNGRSISASRWFTSSSSSPMLGSQDTLPTWLFVTRGNGIKTPTLANAKNGFNNDYVIGRFAFTVYDIGGLLDLNLAGYPSVASSDAADKASPAYADLSVLGLASSSISSLVTWRNAVTGGDADTFREWASGLVRTSGTSNSTALAAARSGHLSIACGDNAVLTRHDLLRNPAVNSTAAGLLTHFSRSLNAPSWRPLADASTTYKYKTNAELSTSVNRNIPNVRATATAPFTHYKDDGSTETYTITIGESLLQRRFSLAKLSWITSSGPKSGISDAAIQACFGLKWDSTNNVWNYVGSDGATTVQSAIKTLADAASAKREPNFFELLQAGMLSGSLGKSGATGASDTGHGCSFGAIYGDESNRYYQIIRIGANMIDQVDADSYVTTINFNSLNFYGIEDLPYFNKVLVKIYGSNFVFGTNKAPLNVYLCYELWNPHQASTSSATPTEFRVKINDEATYGYGYMSMAGGIKSTGPTTLTVRDLSGSTGDPMEFSVDCASSDPKNSYREPRLIRTGTGAKSTDLADTVNNYGTPNAVQLVDAATDLSSDPNFSKIDWLVLNFHATVFSLQYKVGGVWKTYTTFLGHEEAGGLTGVGGKSQFVPALGITNVSGIHPNLYFLSKSDPRTFRFDAQGDINGGGDPADVSLHKDDSSYVINTYYLPSFYTYATKICPAALLARNDSSVAVNSATFSYSDPDTISRPADAWYGCNPFAQGVSTARPVILNRPFRNVGELGYVFCDIPWKSVDLFTSSSPNAILLDLFSISDEPKIVAGRTSLNSPMSKVSQSILSGTASLSGAESIASDWKNYIFGAGDYAPTSQVPYTIAQLPSFVFSNPTSLSSLTVKTQREAMVRAFSGSTQSRTWNLLIDVVAQTGRYPSTAASLNDFLVEGESRYWLSIAIDRYTGKIIDQQLEPANEN